MMPFFLDIEGKSILVVGAGKIAYRKIKNLLDFGARIAVVTREVTEPQIKSLELNVEVRDFRGSDLENRFMVVAATDNKELNAQIVDLCREKNILVNNITSKEYMSVRFAAIVEDDEYIIGVSAKGNPKKSKAMKARIKEVLENN